MSRREDIDSSIWDNEDWLDLPDDQKVVYLWSFTNSRIGMAGVYRVARRHMELETGKRGDDLDRILAALADANFCFYEDGVMWVRSRVKHLRSKSSSIAKAIRSDLDKLAGHPLVDRFVDEYASAEWVWKDPTGGSKGPPYHPSTTPTPPVDTPSGGSGQGRAGQGTGKKNSNGGRARPQAPDPDELPADLPERLRPVVDEVQGRLQRVAAAKGAKAVTLARCGRVVADFPDHAHSRIVADFEDYWTHGAGAGKPQRDVVSAYRNRLGVFAPEPAAALGAAAAHLRSVPAGDELVDALNARAAAMGDC